MNQNFAPGTPARYFDVYNREQLCTVERVDESGRIYVRLKRSAALVWFDAFERDRLESVGTDSGKPPVQP